MLEDPIEPYEGCPWKTADEVRVRNVEFADEIEEILKSRK
jgi:hypothetical protein